jgi:iron complex transport system permease protein
MLSALLVMLLIAAIASLALPMDGLLALWPQRADLLQTIIVELRLPRVMLALIFGAALGMSGAAVQALFANPLASPDINGASSGAALGAVVTGYLLGLADSWALTAGGIAGALLALLALLGLAGKRADGTSFLLAGIAITAVTGAATTLALALAPSPFAFYDVYDWMMGSFVDHSLEQVVLALALTIPALVIIARQADALDHLVLGEMVAASMGHDIVRLRRTIIIASAVAIGACVSICGAIGFIGLVAPVLARALTRQHPGRALIPAALIGAVLLVLADVLVRYAPLGRSLPVGVITALLGVPFFLWLVSGQRWRRGVS